MGYVSLSDDMDRESVLIACNYCKTIMMIIVVVFHSLAFWGIKDWYSISTSSVNRIAETFCNWMASFHVYTFVFVAGFLFFELKMRNGKYNSLSDYIVKKIKRLIVPYVLVSLSWCIPIGTLFFKYSIIEIIKKYFLGMAPSQLWFLLMLFWVYSAAWIILKYIYEKNEYLATIIVAMLFVTSIIIRQFIPNVFMIWRSFEFLPIFWAGVLINAHCNRANLLNVVVIGALHIVLFGVLEIISISSIYVESILQMLMHICGATFMFFIVQYANNWININDALKKWIVLLGKYNMPIYLLHQQIIYIGLIVTCKLPIALGMVINIVLSVMVAIVISKILRKNKITLYVLGEGK